MRQQRTDILCARRKRDERSCENATRSEAYGGRRRAREDDGAARTRSCAAARGAARCAAQSASLCKRAKRARRREAQIRARARDAARANDVARVMPRGEYKMRDARMLARKRARANDPTRQSTIVVSAAMPPRHQRPADLIAHFTVPLSIYYAHRHSLSPYATYTPLAARRPG